MELPKDPAILLSYVNTQLRDHYNSLDDLCISLLVNKEMITATLKEIDYEYSPIHNQFI